MIGRGSENSQRNSVFIMKILYNIIRVVFFPNTANLRLALILIFNFKFYANPKKSLLAQILIFISNFINYSFKSEKNACSQ